MFKLSQRIFFSTCCFCVDLSVGVRSLGFILCVAYFIGGSFSLKHIQRGIYNFKTGGIKLQDKAGSTLIFLLGIPNIVAGVIHLFVNIISVVYSLRLYIGARDRRRKIIYQNLVINMLNMVLYGLETILMYALITSLDAWTKEEHVFEFAVYVMMFFICAYSSSLILSFHNQITKEDGSFDLRTGGVLYVSQAH